MQKMLNKLRNEDGFTLVEMAIVLMIIAILLIVIIPRIDGVSDSVNETSEDAIVNTVNTQKVLYRIDNNLSGDAEVPLAELEKEKYLTEEQVEAYNNYTSDNTN